MFSLVTLAATYIPVVANLTRSEWGGLDLRIWALIAFTLFAVSVLSIVIRLWWNLSRLLSERGQLEMEKLRREVRDLRSKDMNINPSR
jgi:hypothetical protein